MGLSTTTLIILLAIFIKAWQSTIWPWGIAQPWEDRMVYSEVDESNDSLRLKREFRLRPGSCDQLVLIVCMSSLRRSNQETLRASS